MTSALNLSLLARGVGEVKRNGSEKIDVVLEPSTRLYLPPIHNQQVNSRNAYYESKKLSLPKTFITRKGALLLFSEDFAQKSKGLQHDVDANKSGVTSAFGALDLHTVEDLTKSILSYGGTSGKDINLHFVKEGQTQRRVRPGFSARRKRINDDLSHMPAPYRIMHQMLLAPGMLSGYSFLRQTTDGTQSDLMTLDEEGYDRPGQGELKIVEINDGEVKTVDYGNLPEEQKKNVLADLLVKSAISHALEKQKQVPSKFKADVHIPLFSV
ncbi:hypothetical protein LSH36_293g02039 [Paralvinella palmiformis]|uniref:Uncharacterized protein n=1 Tax=Paralvinella palmiformis TaxID=53620 RepID=A0AAD9N1R9_9ANNE|nr:hypothetical protein LSH36_293g02039 [Paralvinella palmiformis]